jgi:hypothetical protein
MDTADTATMATEAVIGRDIAGITVATGPSTTTDTIPATTITATPGTVGGTEASNTAARICKQREDSCYINQLGL